MVIKTQFPKLLNDLHEMQESLHYAARRQVLRDALATILSLEQKLDTVTTKEAIGRRAIELLRDLKSTEAAFYRSAIELEVHHKRPDGTHPDGKKYEADIDQILKDYDEP